jgi:NSS family neurotransmitter:Na+ symporter
MVSLLEVPVAFAVQRSKMRRRAAAAIIGGLIFLLGVPSALGYGVLGGMQISGRPLLDAIDHAVSSYFLPLGGILIALFVGWVVGRKQVVSLADLDVPFFGAAWCWLLRIVVPATIAVILLRSAGAL